MYGQVRRMLKSKQMPKNLEKNFNGSYEKIVLNLCCAGSAWEWSLLQVPVRLGPSRSYWKSELVVWKDAEELIAGGGMPIGVIRVVGEGVEELDEAAFELTGVVSDCDEGWRGYICRAGPCTWLKRCSKWSCYDEKKNVAASPKLKLTGTCKK